MERALELFYQQVVHDNGLPFTPGKVAKILFPCLEDISRKELDAELNKGMQDLRAGKTKNAEDVFASFHQQIGRMNFRVAIIETAKQVLTCIFEYIAIELYNPKAAESLLQKLEASISSLRMFPNRFPG